MLTYIRPSFVHSGYWLASRYTEGYVKYVEKTFSQELMVLMYRSADIFLTPYRTEGFNLPGNHEDLVKG